MNNQLTITHTKAKLCKYLGHSFKQVDVVSGVNVYSKCMRRGCETRRVEFPNGAGYQPISNWVWFKEHEAENPPPKEL